MTELINSNLLSFFLNLRYWDRAELHLTPGLWWSRTPIKHPVFNSIHLMRPPGLMRGIRIAIGLCVPVIWRVWPGQEETAAQLEQNGFVDHGAAAGMVADLSLLKWSEKMPAGLSIKPVESLSDFIYPFTTGFDMPDFVAGAYQDYYSQIPANVPLYHFVGWVDDKPVSSASLWTDGGIAGLYNVATLPSYRGRGIGTAISFCAMELARIYNYKIMTLQAAPDAVGMYKRLGFEEVCQIKHFIYEVR